MAPRAGSPDLSRVLGFSSSSAIGSSLSPTPGHPAHSCRRGARRAGTPRRERDGVATGRVRGGWEWEQEGGASLGEAATVAAASGHTCQGGNWPAKPVAALGGRCLARQP
eukprot:scaffold853_cov386-Prasinococcus_capsulatus_cf.AAC.10